MNSYKRKPVLTTCQSSENTVEIKENLVYDKFTGGVIGFINLGNINDELLSFEQEFLSDQDHQPIANHLLVLMVRGIFFKLEFPLVHFGTTGVTADQLFFPIVWEGVRQVEGIGLKVIFITADGASPNRKFFKMHHNLVTTCQHIKPAILIHKKKGQFFLLRSTSLNKNRSKLLVSF